MNKFLGILDYQKTLTSLAITAFKAKSRQYIRYLLKAISYSSFRETLIIIEFFLGLVIKNKHL